MQNDKTADDGKKRQSKKKLPRISQEQMQEVLDTLYAKALDGVPMVSRSVDEMVDDYRDKYSTDRDAARALANNQVVKCGTSGFITGLGGIITLPVAIPANVSSVMYVQMRMVASIAKLGGFDTRSDQVQTLAYACLAGTAASDILKDAGIKVGEKFAVAAIKKIPGATLVKINQRVGFRLITEFGEKGIVNMGKLVPLVGGFIGGGFDVVSTKVIARNAIKLFIDKELPV